MSKPLQLTEQMQYAYAAIQHLWFDRSTVDLAEELGVSRFMVGRMIKRAREENLIEVRSALPSPIDTELSRALARAYDLETAVVVASSSDSEHVIRSTIAEVAAQLLVEIIDEDDTVGLGPGRTIIETCDRIDALPSCDVVQLTGVAAKHADAYLSAIMRISRVAKGRVFSLHAPIMASTTAAWTAITSEPPLRTALARMNQLDKAVLTIGGWPDSSLLATQVADSGELAGGLAAGVVAELGTTLLNADGAEVDYLPQRLIGISTAQLTRCPLRIALGGGPGKRAAVKAALRSGLIDVLVTDSATATAALHDRPS